MMRRPDWVQRLHDELDAANARPFQWGEHDCCLFAARVMDAITDGGYVADLKAEYHDKPSALRFIAREGGLEAAVTARVGDPVPWWKAKPGDICLIESPDALGTVGVVMGSTVAFVRADRGLEFLPIDQARACWRVP